MRKLLFILMASIVALTACGEVEEQAKEVDDVETSSDSDTEEAVEEESEEEEAAVEYDEILLDSDNATVVLESIATIKDETWDEEYHEIKFSIENNSDKTLVIQADEVSIDGLMVTDNVFFSEEISAGKKANGKMEIEFFDDELPPLDEELEFILNVIDEETFMTIEEESVSISIK